MGRMSDEPGGFAIGSHLVGSVVEALKHLAVLELQGSSPAADFLRINGRQNHSGLLEYPRSFADQDVEQGIFYEFQGIG